MKEYDLRIREKFGDSMNMPTKKRRNIPREWIPYEDDEIEPCEMPENDICLENFNVSLTDALINAEVLLHRRDDEDGPLINARVVRKLIDENGNLIGHANKKYKSEYDNVGSEIFKWRACALCGKRYSPRNIRKCRSRWMS